MDSKSQAVLNAALALPETDHAAIVSELLATLACDTGSTADDELDRRLDEARNDPAATVGWAELKNER
jgi:hypothetical protein